MHTWRFVVCIVCCLKEVSWDIIGWKEQEFLCDAFDHSDLNSSRRLLSSNWSYACLFCSREKLDSSVYVCVCLCFFRILVPRSNMVAETEAILSNFAVQPLLLCFTSLFSLACSRLFFYNRYFELYTFTRSFLLTTEMRTKRSPREFKKPTCPCFR